MKKDNIFFGEDGLSTTSANHIANMAKEAYQHIDEELGNIRFFSKEISLLDGGHKQLLEEGQTSKDLYSYLDSLKTKAQLQSLIAWLREAIKAKEAIANEIKSWDYSEIAEKLFIEIPQAPDMGHCLTEDDYLGLLSVKERNRYYYLETFCAVLGKFIQPDGAYSKARKALHQARTNPRIAEIDGKNTIITHNIPSVSVEEVDEVFFDMQAQYRSYQAELNGMKHKMELAIQADRDKKEAEYDIKFEEYNGEYKKVIHKIVTWKNKQLNEVRDLKIIIPNDLKEIFNRVKILGKKL